MMLMLAQPTGCFFANRTRGVPLDQCPDNDSKNVDTVDGLLMGIPVSLAYCTATPAKSLSKVKSCIGTTRKSKQCHDFAAKIDGILRQLIAGEALKHVLESAAKPMRLSLDTSILGPDPISP